MPKDTPFYTNISYGSPDLPIQVPIDKIPEGIIAGGINLTQRGRQLAKKYGLKGEDADKFVANFEAEALKPTEEEKQREKEQRIMDFLMKLQDMKALQRFQEKQMGYNNLLRRARMTPQYLRAVTATRDIIESAGGSYNPDLDPHENWNAFVEKLPLDERHRLANELSNRLNPPKEKPVVDRSFLSAINSLDELYKTLASIEKGVDPFTGAILSQDNIDNARYMIKKQIAKRENLIKRAWPDLYNQYIGEGSDEQSFLRKAMEGRNMERNNLSAGRTSPSAGRVMRSKSGRLMVRDPESPTGWSYAD